MSKISQLDGGAIGGGTRDTVGSVAPAKSVGAGSPDAGTADTPAENSDSVSITEPGRALAALSQAVQSSPDINNSRVATLRQSIEGGTYGVDDDAIAGRMLQIEQDLGGTAR